MKLKNSCVAILLVAVTLPANRCAVPQTAKHEPDFT